jgi:hypothetical protein
MHYVGRVDAAPSVDPWELAGAQTGLTRRTLIDASVGAIHTQLDIHDLAPGGEVRTHCHSFGRPTGCSRARPPCCSMDAPTACERGTTSRLPWVPPSRGPIRVTRRRPG